MASDSRAVTACCCVAFVFIFILLIGAIVWCNVSSFECFTNVMGSTGDTIKNKLMGGKFYKALNLQDDVVKVLQDMHKMGKKSGVIAILADWCGYCKQLKESGTLREVSKKAPVYVMTDQHKQTKELMTNVKAGGFPTLIIYKNGKFELYEGPRDAMSILSKLN